MLKRKKHIETPKIQAVFSAIWPGFIFLQKEFIHIDKEADKEHRQL